MPRSAKFPEYPIFHNVGETLSTGSLAMDLALGGGWPRGRMVEIYGPAGAGKTTLALEAVAQTQKEGGLAAFIDADFATTENSAERFGIDLERMPFLRSNRLEEVATAVEELVAGQAMSLIVLDGIGSLVRKEFQKVGEDNFPTTQDTLHQTQMDALLRALLLPLAQSKAVLLITNRVVEKVGVMYGNPEMTPWVTHPLRDFATHRVEVRKGAWTKEREQTIGTEINVKIVKNRTAASNVSLTLSLNFASGLNRGEELLKMGIEAGLIHKRGNVYSYREMNLGLGLIPAQRTLLKNGEMAEELRKQILESFAGKIHDASE
jgi:recombination protein RecA